MSSLPRPYDRSALRQLGRLLSLGIFVLGCGATVTVCADDWPQWRGPQRDGVWAESNIVEALPATGLDIRWRITVSAGWSSPVVWQGASS